MFSRTLLAATIATAGGLAAASPASAAPTPGGLLAKVGKVTSALMPKQDPACAAAPTTKPFRNWNDHANYVPVPGGSFEDGLGAWTAAGPVSLVADNEPWQVGGDTHARAAHLPRGASITSGTFCGGLEYPTIRGFARGDGRPATMLVTVRYTGRDSLLHSLPLGILQVGEQWRPTGITLTASGIPLFTGMTLGVTVTALTGDIVVDDLYVDPYRRS